MRLYQRGSKGTWWVDMEVDGKRVRRSLGTTNRAEAERLLPCDTPSSLGALFEMTLRNHWAGTKGEATARINGSKVVAVLGERRDVRTITRGDVMALCDTLKRDHAPATVNRILATLRKMLVLAVLYGLMDYVPSFPRLKEPQGRLRIVSPDEEAALVARLDVDMADLVVVLVDTGMRMGEALKLDSRDVLLDKRMIQLWETKGGHARSIPMTPRVFSILERRPDIFRMLDKHQVRRAWNRAKADMGIDDPEFTPHALRHTFGTRLVQRGVAIYQVQKLMGHRSIKMTERYAKVFAEDLRGAIDVLAG